MIYYNHLTVLVGVFIALFLALAPPVFADLKVSFNPSIDLANTSNDTELTTSMLVIPSHQGIKSLEEALNFTQWIKPDKDTLSAPRQFSTSWLKASLNNSSDQALTHWLVVEPWRVNRVDTFFLDPVSNKIFRKEVTGLEIPAEQRTVNNGKTIIPVPLNAGETQQLIIRVYSDSLPFLSIKNWEPVAYSQSVNSNRAFQVAIFAGIIMLLIVLALQFNASLMFTGLWLLVAFIFETEKNGFFSNYLFSFLEGYSANIRLTSWVLTEQLFLTSSVFLLGLSRSKLWRNLLIVTALTTLITSGLTFVLDGATFRNLGVLITGSYAISWLFIIKPASRIKNTGQLALIFLLSIYWVISSFLLIGYTFNFYYTSAFVALRVYIEVLIALALILTYSWQHKYQLKIAADKLKAQELDNRKTLELTVKKRTEDLHSALETAKKANTAKVNFLGQVTHDLRSPLTAILGYAQLQAVEAVNSQKANQIIQESALYMKDLVDGLVNYARDITTHEDDLRDVYLIAFIDNLVNQTHLLANKQNNHFQLKIETELPTVIRCSSTQLQRILLNLLDNAAKYTTAGKITLSIAVDNQQTHQAVLVFKISDTGLGIAPHQLKKIYTPFYQGTDNSPGSGLGLAICFELIEKLGGTLNLKSQLGIGTLATCTIPYIAGDEQLVAPSLPAVQDLLPQLDAQGLSAWVIEDSLQIGELLTSELTAMGFKAEQVTSAEAFIEAIAKEQDQPGVIITDYRLPKASGEKVLASAYSKWPQVPVILLSATQNSNPQPFESTALRFSAYLSKPVDLLELRLKIAELCNLTPKL